MPTLNELMEKFASPEAAQTDVADEDFVVDQAVDDGTTKIASGGSDMNTLQDIYMQISDHDHIKTAQVAAEIPTEEEEIDFAKMAEALADVEAEEYVQAEEPAAQDGDIIKVASEYDAAGRIMARGFYDEFQKLAGALDTHAAPNQDTETPSEALTPSLGDRSRPTMETNYAGSVDHTEKLEIGPNAQVKQVNADQLKPAKTISAGQGTGDDAEAGAVAMGGNQYATVRDLQA